MINAQHRLLMAFVVALTASTAATLASSSREIAPAMPYQTAGGDSARCPVRTADLDKLTQFRWELGQYRANRVFIPTTMRVDVCELIGKDNSGARRTGMIVNSARGATAQAFAKHWRDACAGSLMPDARGTVQPIRGVTGGFQCVTASGKSSAYWVESAAQTFQLEAEDDAASWAQVIPQLLAAAVR